MRQLSVFSTAFGPRPGAIVPTTKTGGVSSGNVSTLMRGVTTAANTTSAMAAMSTAMGLRRARPVMGAPGSRPRRSADGATRSASSRSRPDGGLADQLALPVHRPRGGGRLASEGNLFRFDGVAFLQQGAAFADDQALGGPRSIEEQRALGLPFHGPVLLVGHILRHDEQLGLAPAHRGGVQRN